ncbi:MAG: hypothetical protein J4N63_07805 [Chloroflexi bacterium]|nr:hypothetical protein [Chloroflexota bacterium]
MPMMFGFGGQRKQMLEAELQRFVEEMPQLGMETMYLVGPFARGEVDPGTVLDLVLIQETDQPSHRRADFWTSHLRPRIGVNFFVYTRDEFENPPAPDPLLHDAFNNGERVHG